MNDTLKIIADRFSCRGYDGRPVEKDKVDAIAKAALQAPSAMNLQPWEIIVITDKGMIDEMDAVAMEDLATRPDNAAYNRIMERGGKIFYNAPCMFLVLKETGPRWAELDCGIVTQNIALAATSLGLDNIIVAMAAIPLNGPKGDAFKQRLGGFAPGYEFGMSVCVGYGNVTKPPHEINPAKVKFI